MTACARAVSIVLVVALALPPLPAQTKAPIVQEKVRVQLVQIPLLASDRQGRPVGDLRAGEITAELRGKPVKVSYFDPLREPANPNRPPGLFRLHLEAPGGWNSPLAAGAREPRYLAFVVNVENDTPMQHDEATRALADFLGSKLDAGDRVSVFSYNGMLNLELPFTDDKTAARSAVFAAAARTGRPRLDPRTNMRSLLHSLEACVASGGSQFEKRADPKCVRDTANEYSGQVRPRSEDYLRALQDLVRYLGGLEGRKSVVVVGHGVVVNWTRVFVAAYGAVFGGNDTVNDVQQYTGVGASPQYDMDKLLDELVQRKVSLSFLDRVAPPSDDFQASRGEALAPGITPSRMEYDAAVSDSEQLATSSGGVRVHSTDIGPGMERVLALLDASYEIGIELDEYLSPKDFKKLDIHCSRKGVKLVRSRGAIGPPPADEPVMRGRFAIGKATPVEKSTALRVPLRLQVDPKEIGYQRGTAEASASFSVHLSLLSADAGRLADTFHFVTHSYDLSLWDKGDVEPVTFDGWLEAPPGEYTLRAWLRNADSDREGAVTGRIKIGGVAPAEPPVAPETSAPAQSQAP